MASSTGASSAAGTVHVPPGGASTLVLGGEVSAAEAAASRVTSNRFANGSDQNCGNVLTERSTTRLHQAPGGTSTVCLGGESSESRFSHVQNQSNGSTPAASPRFPYAPGGSTSVVLGQDEEPVAGAVTGKISSNSFANGANQNAGNILTDRPTTRLHQAPGGTSTLVLGDDVAPATVAATSNRVAPGGQSTICLGGAQEVTSSPNGTPRISPGGETTVVLGSDASEARFERAQGAETVSETLEATQRFPYAPGGATSVVLGNGTEMQEHAVTAKVGPLADTDADLKAGGRPCDREPLVLGGDATAQPIVANPCGIAPGGNSTLVLGGQDDVPALAQTQTRIAPGGATTIVLSDECQPADTALAARGSPGGESTVLLGGDAPAARFSHCHTSISATVPEAAPRFPCAPGGTSTVVLGGEVSTDRDPMELSTRVAPGGNSTVRLGSDPSSARFSQCHGGEVADATVSEPGVRFPYAPGGATSVVLGGDTSNDQSSTEPSTRVAPGGNSTLLLGGDVSSERFIHRSACEATSDTALEPGARFPYAPGGTSTFVVGVEDAPTDLSSTCGRIAASAPGGESTIVLGGGSFESENPFGERRRENDASSVPDPTPRFVCAPGGNATIRLTDEVTTSSRPLASARVSPGGASTLSLGCDDPANSNAVNASVLAGRAPGGETTICLGDSISSERFVHRQGAEAVDALVPEPPTRFPCAPGGDSALILGGATVDTPLSTRTAPGGETTILLGGDDSAERFAKPGVVDAATASVTPLARFPCAPGGADSVSLGGADAPSDLSNSKARQVGGAVTLKLGGEADPPARRGRKVPISGGGDENVDVSNVIAASEFDQDVIKEEAPLLANEEPTVVIG